MGHRPLSDGGGPPRPGRPPRINRQMIAEAAHHLGLDRITLRDVADHLGVSVAALYHYVTGKEDLLRLAAEYSATMVPAPTDRDQHWAQWLLEWAVYNRDVFLSRPGLLSQYVEGAISTEAIAGNLDAILGLLVRQGFTLVEADAAYHLVSSYAMGDAVQSIREREATQGTSPARTRHEQLLGGNDSRALPHLRALLAAAAAHGVEPFAVQVATILIGVAVRRGDDWQPIAEMIDRSA